MVGANTDTKQKLIETTLDLIWKNSYGAVSVDDICKNAQVKKGSFYYFFPTKDDLAVAALDAAATLAKAAREEAVSTGKSAVERLHQYAEFTYQAQVQAAEKYGHVCGCPATSIGSELACHDSRIRESADVLRRQHLEYYEEIVKDFVAEGLLPKDTDIKEKSQKVNCYLTGLLTNARIDNNLKTLRQDLTSGVLQILGVGDRKAGNIK